MTKKPTTTVPPYRLHKGSGQGYVTLSRRRIYLGRFDATETRERYHATVSEWEANGRRLQGDQDDITITEVCARYLAHARRYYRRPDGTLTSEVEAIASAMRPMVDLYGRLPACEFGPLKLKAVRLRMIETRWCRTSVNKQVSRVKTLFRWAAENELVTAEVHHAIQTVAGLKRGRCEARESDPIRPVPQAHIDAVRGRVGFQVRALIDLQLLTGARAGELVMLRPIDFDTSGRIWIAKLEQHKTTHHGRERLIYFGPKAQEVVGPFMTGRPVIASLFSPQEADTEHRATLQEARKTPMSCGNRPGSNRRRRPQRTPGEHYTVASYRRAIHRACSDAEVPTWGPHRLRHNAATTIRRGFGIEGAQLLLGHARADVTQIYAEVNEAKALEVAAKIG